VIKYHKKESVKDIKRENFWEDWIKNGEENFRRETRAEFVKEYLDKYDDKKLLEMTADYYDLLGIDVEDVSAENPFPGRKVSRREIKEKINQLNLRFHPDKNEFTGISDRELAKSIKGKIDEASECLNNSHNRKKYDFYLFKIEKEEDKPSFNPNKERTQKFKDFEEKIKVDDQLIKEITSLLEKELEIKGLTIVSANCYLREILDWDCDMDYKDSCQKKSGREVWELLACASDFLEKVNKIKKNDDDFRMSGILDILEGESEKKNSNFKWRGSWQPRRGKFLRARN